MYLSHRRLAIVAQVEPPGTVPAGESLVGGAATAFFSTLVVAGLLVLFVPEYVERMTDAVSDDPVTDFVVGFGSFVALAILVVVLVLTVVGILVAIPLAILLWLLVSVGSAVAYLRSRIGSSITKTAGQCPCSSRRESAASSR